MEKKRDVIRSQPYISIRGIRFIYLLPDSIAVPGLNRGDRIALLGEGRNDWIISELGILYAGGINVSLSAVNLMNRMKLFSASNIPQCFIIVQIRMQVKYPDKRPIDLT